MGVLLVLFLAFLAWATLHGPRYRVTLCMEYAGRTACKTVSAKSEASALRAAAENACADIASGVTDTVKCQRAEPQSVRWLQRPGS